jgi:hypothetical protein
MDPIALLNRFTYHSPTSLQIDKYQALREQALEFAELINNVAPESPEKTIAINHIDQAVMYANAAIARHTN